MVPWARKSTAPIFLASSSKTRINSSPMIFRLRSGSSTPASLMRKRVSASTRIKLAERWAKMDSTSSPSSFRIRPWSTKTQVSCFPMASARSAAQTEESTPPERASSTFPSPTFSRMARMEVFI